MNKYSIFKSFAIIGSSILVLCVLPQIMKVYKNKSAKDISNGWLILTMMGLVFLCFYSFYFELWEIFFPILVQFFLFLFLVFLKKYYDNLPVLPT